MPRKKLWDAQPHCALVLHFVLGTWFYPFFYIALQTPRGFTTRSGNDICNILIFRKKIDENGTAHGEIGSNLNTYISCKNFCATLGGNEPEKIEPRRGRGACGRGSRAWLLLSTAEVLLGESRETAHKESPTSFQAAQRVENRRAGTDEGISTSG